ncbi:MAG: tryptophan synthase subunit alpha, partial [Nitrospirae bacterium]
MKNRIEETFNRLKKEGKKALIPYIMAGDPDLDHTESFLLELEEAGADIVELGIPFTDPVADGPTIQRAAERALSSGTTLRRVMDFIPRLREKTDIPIVLMTYYNPVFKYGVPKFAKKAAEVGVDGVIIPDLIPEEAGELLRASEEVGLSTV